jgi:hypothetical protein
MKTAAEIKEAAEWLAIIKKIVVIAVLALAFASCGSTETICDHVHTHYSGYR